MVEETIEIGDVEIRESTLEALIEKFDELDIEEGSHKGVYRTGFVLEDDGFEDNEVILHDLQTGAIGKRMSIDSLRDKIDDTLDQFAEAFKEAIGHDAYEKVVVEESALDGQIVAFVQQNVMSDDEWHLSKNVSDEDSPFNIAEVDGRALRYVGVYGEDHKYYPDECEGPVMSFQYE